MSSSFEFKTNYFKALSGLDLARNYIINHKLKSGWSRYGFGWQELLHEASSAGFYAACEGIEMLGYQNDGTFKLDGQVFDGVYLNHLLKIIGPKIPVHNFYQKQQRIETITQVAKYARFIIVTSKLKDLVKNKSIFKEAISILKKCQMANGSWSSVTDQSSNTNHACSAEALIALFSCGDIKSIEFLRGLEWALSRLEDFLNSDDPKLDVSSFTILSWCLSEIFDALHDKQKDLLIRTVKKLIDLGVVNLSRDIGDSYHIKELGRNDYYRFNSQLLLCSTILNCCIKGALEHTILYNIIEILDDIILQFNEKGYYISNYRQRFYFWENYHAFFVLYKFVRLTGSNPEILEYLLMYVNPKFFAKKHFIINPSLCIVLMLFREKWSNKIFNVFKDVVEKDFGMTCWRSDNEFRDDIIIQSIWQKLNEAKFVIADCSNKNANVFYELGLAHTLGKPVFMCAQSRNDFVFDISSIRSFAYGMRPNGIIKLKRELSSFIRTL